MGLHFLLCLVYLLRKLLLYQLTSDDILQYFWLKNLILCVHMLRSSLKSKLIKHFLLLSSLLVPNNPDSRHGCACTFLDWSRIPKRIHSQLSHSDHKVRSFLLEQSLETHSLVDFLLLWNQVETDIVKDLCTRHVVKWNQLRRWQNDHSILLQPFPESIVLSQEFFLLLLRA